MLTGKKQHCIDNVFGPVHKKSLNHPLSSFSMKIDGYNKSCDKPNNQKNHKPSQPVMQNCIMQQDITKCSYTLCQTMFVACSCQYELLLMFYE